MTNAVTLQIMCITTGVAITFGQSVSEDPARADEALLERVQAHPGVRRGGVGLVLAPSGARVIVAVGSAEPRSTDPSAREEAVKSAELDARVRMAAFVKGERVTAMTRSRLKLDSSTCGYTEVSDEYEEKISGTLQHEMPGVRLIGSYADKTDGRVFATVVFDEDMLATVPLVTDGFPLFPRMVTVRGEARATQDPARDVQAAIRDALVRAQWSAGGARIYSVRQRGTTQPFEHFEQVQVAGWVDSFSIVQEWRYGAQQHVLIRAVVVSDPLRGLGESASPRPASTPRQISEDPT